MASPASSANLTSGTEESATVVDGGGDQASPTLGRSSEQLVDVELNRTPPPSITSVPGITSITVSVKVTSGEETVSVVQEVTPVRNVFPNELLNQIVQLCYQLIGAASQRRQAKEKFPYHFLVAAGTIVGWTLTTLFSESVTKIFQDFSHKWMRASAFLAVNLAILAVAGAWGMWEKSSFFSKCLLGIGATFMFASLLFCEAPILAQLL